MDEPIRVRLPSDAPAPPSSTDERDAFAGHLEELERICQAATPGPWTSHQGSIWSASSRNPICDIDAGSPDEYDPDARFIEAARHALPKLIAKVRELQAELENAEALVEMQNEALKKIVEPWERAKRTYELGAEIALCCQERAQKAEAELAKLRGSASAGGEDDNV